MATPTLTTSEPNPTLIWDTMHGHQRSAALQAGIELDVFTAIGEGSDTSEAIAARCNASQRGIRILCDYLTIIGLLSKDGNGYNLTPTSATFLDRRSPGCLASTLKFLHSPKLIAAFADLTQTVRRGTTILPEGGVAGSETDEWVLFAESMAPLTGAAAEFMADLATRGAAPVRRVLDIAASHGLFGIAVARNAPEAEIVALDFPKVLKVAEKNARAAGIADRYRLLPGDAFTVDFGSGYDVVLLTNLLHHFDQETCTSLLRKIHGCMNPGGRLLTLEFVPNEDRISPPIPASFSMMMLANTPSGDAYTMKEHESMLRAAGFQHNELLQVPKSPQQVIVSTK